MNIDVEKITKGVDWAKEQKKTTLFILLLISCTVYLLWHTHSQLNVALADKQILIEHRNEIQQQFTDYMLQKSRVEEDCAEKIRIYFDMLKELGILEGKNVKTISSMNNKTNALLQQVRVNNNNNDDDE